MSIDSKNDETEKKTNKRDFIIGIAMILALSLIAGIYAYKSIHEYWGKFNRTELICDYCGTSFLGEPFTDYSKAVGADNVLVLCPDCRPGGDGMVAIMTPYGS